MPSRSRLPVVQNKREVTREGDPMETADSRFLLGGNAFEARLEQELNELTDRAESRTTERISQAANEDKYEELQKGITAWTGEVCSCLTEWYWKAFDLVHAISQEDIRRSGATKLFSNKCWVVS